MLKEIQYNDKNNVFLSTLNNFGQNYSINLSFFYFVPRKTNDWYSLQNQNCKKGGGV